MCDARIAVMSVNFFIHVTAQRVAFSAVLDDGFYPLNDRFLNFRVSVFLLLCRITSCDLERMIAAMDRVQRRKRRETAEDRLQLRRRAECIAAALDEQHRALHARQVRIARLIGPARWMKWIAEQDDAADDQIRIFRGNVCRCAAAHGLAADEEAPVRALNLLTCSSNNRAVACDELRHAIGHAALLIHVVKIKRHDVEPALAEPPREAHDKRMTLTRTRAVRENQRVGSS